MPDSQHFDLLKQGVFAWNQWRDETALINGQEDRDGEG